MFCSSTLPTNLPYWASNANLADSRANVLDVEDVAARLSPDRWLAVIASQPQLEQFFDWALVEKKPSLYWDDLLRHQPQFACHCDFEHLKDWQIRRIRRRQPKLFEDKTREL